MGSPLGSDDYRDGALARIGDARSLSDQEQWVGAIYLAGRAVEAMLRSLLWCKSRQQEVGHDLKKLLRRARSVGMINEDETRFEDYINEVWFIWHNNLRFIGDRRFLRDLRAVGRDRRIEGRPVKGDPLKPNAKRTVEICEVIVARGEVVWKRYRGSSIGS